MVNWYKKAQQKDFSFLDDYTRPSEEDIRYEQFDQEQQAVRDVLEEFKSRQPNEKQPWPVIPFGRVKKIWEDYMRMGFVRDEKGIDQIAQKMIQNVHRLSANTYLAGHTQSDPQENFDEYNMNEEDQEKFYEYMIDERGQYIISDYGLPKLEKLATQLEHTYNAEEKLQLIDRMFNIVHQRSDLPAFFIEGGSDSLDKLFGRPSEVEASNMGWYKKAKKFTDEHYKETYNDQDSTVI